MAARSILAVHPAGALARLARPTAVRGDMVPCTMVFADVSGFTRLSERPGRRGNDGADQLVDVINACSYALLVEAYGRIAVAGPPRRHPASKLAGNARSPYTAPVSQ